MAEPVWSAPLDEANVGAGYTNSVTIGTTQWDVTLDFQFRTPAPGNAANAELPSQRVARLVMSPMHAKVLAEVIAGAIRAWEHNYGALPDAEVLLPGLTAKLAEPLGEAAPQNLAESPAPQSGEAMEGE